MRDLCIALALFTCCGSEELSPVSEVIWGSLGVNVTIPCSEPFSRKMLWFRQLSGEMTELAGVVMNKAKNTTETECRSGDTCRYSTEEDKSRKSFSLKITGVAESDQGLYFCVQWGRDEIRFGKGIRLIFPDSGTPSPSCWTLLAFTPPLVATVTALCMYGLCHRRGCHPALNRSHLRNNDVTMAGNMHYASLHLPKKSQHSRQGGSPPLPGDIIYASVAPTNQNH